LARSKFKIGDKVSFNFAGLSYVGILEKIEIDNWGTVTNTWFKVRHENGTIYPCREENLTIING